MISASAPADATAAHIAAFNALCGFDFSKLPPADKRLHWRRLQRMLVQWLLTTNGNKFTANSLQFMAFNTYGFSPAEWTDAFPDVETPLPPPLAPILGANPNTA